MSCGSRVRTGRGGLLPAPEMLVAWLAPLISEYRDSQNALKTHPELWTVSNTGFHRAPATDHLCKGAAHSGLSCPGHVSSLRDSHLPLPHPTHRTIQSATSYVSHLPQQGGGLSYNHCPHAWQAVSSPLLLPKSLLFPLHPTQPPTMA